MRLPLRIYFALCEFVDSSKLELQRIVREGLDNLRAEMA